MSRTGSMPSEPSDDSTDGVNGVTGNTPAADERRLVRLALVLLLGWSLLGVYAVKASVPETSVRLPMESGARQWLPQVLSEGWVYFTHDLRSPDLLVWVQDDDGRWRDARLSPMAQPQYLMGLDRTVLAQHNELELVHDAVGDSSAAAVDCAEDTTVQACITAAAQQGPQPEVANPTPSATICGTVALVWARLPSWVQARLADPAYRPLTATVVRMPC